MEIKPEIFLSYSSKNNDIADRIDKTFSAIGISMIRDERDLAYRGSIEKFMVDSVRNTEYVLMLLSDDYLKSEYCIFEAGELMKNNEFDKKVLPVYLYDINFFITDKRNVYYDFWEGRIKKAEENLVKYGSCDFENQLARIKQSRKIIADLFERLRDFKLKSFVDLESSDYKQLFELIGIDKDGLLQKCIHLVNIKDEEEQIIALDELQNIYKNNQEIDFAKALIYQERKRYKAARRFNEDYIRKYTYDVHTVHYNLAFLLESEFKEYENARTHYEKAIDIKPDYTLAHNNLGILLVKHFEDYDIGRKHFEIAIRSKPTFEIGYFNLARLCKDKLYDYAGAEENFRKAIEINPSNFDSYFLFAELAEDNLQEYNMAIDLYYDAIAINPLSFMAHYKLAQVLANHSSSPEEAVEQYKVSIMLDPKFVGAHTNLAILLTCALDDFTGAKNHFEEALKIDPDNDFAHYNLAVLLADFLKDPANACSHYQKAIQINPRQINQQFEQLCSTLNIKK